MGIVWEAYHKGVPLLGVPGITLDKFVGAMNHESSWAMKLHGIGRHPSKSLVHSSSRIYIYIANNQGFSHCRKGNLKVFLKEEPLEKKIIIEGSVRVLIILVPSTGTPWEQEMVLGIYLQCFLSRKASELSILATHWGFFFPFLCLLHFVFPSELVGRLRQPFRKTIIMLIRWRRILPNSREKTTKNLWNHQRSTLVLGSVLLFAESKRLVGHTIDGNQKSGKLTSWGW